MESKDSANNINAAHDLLTSSKCFRILVAGVFDLFHIGHANALKKAKTLFDDVCLVVGGKISFLNFLVHSDETTERMKGKVVMKMDERVEVFLQIYIFSY